MTTTLFDLFQTNFKTVFCGGEGEGTSEWDARQTCQDKGKDKADDFHVVSGRNGIHSDYGTILDAMLILI